MINLLWMQLSVTNTVAVLKASQLVSSFLVKDSNVATAEGAQRQVFVTPTNEITTYDVPKNLKFTIDPTKQLHPVLGLNLT